MSDGAMEKGIRVTGVSKNFKEVRALDQIDLMFEEHKIYGLLGRNGAGKSTLLNIISNRIFPDCGEVWVDGIPLSEGERAIQRLYVMSEQTLYPEKTKIKELFQWSKTFYPDFDMEYAMRLAQQFGLNIKKSMHSLSTGYVSITKNIIALSVNTPYVLLDEPVLGLDANHRELFYRILLDKYSKQPFTAIISTHLIEEVSNVIEDIVIIQNGKIIRNETRESLMRKGYTVSGNGLLVDSYLVGREVIGTDSLGGLKTAYILGKPDSVPEGLEITGMDLQKLFIQLTNEQEVAK